MTRKSYRVRFPGGSGYELTGIIDRPEQADGCPTVVLSHCFTCNKDLKAIVRISRGLADHGIAVLRFDMTGLGGSEGDFSQTNFTTNMADLRAAIEFARSELGSVNALLGHSFGGAASLAVASDSNSIQAVSTLAAPSDSQHLAEILLKMNPAIVSHGQGIVSIGGREWTIPQKMLDDFRSHDMPAMLANISVPTMLMHSPVDETVSFDHALRIMMLITNSQSDSPTPVSLVSLDQADHLLARNPSDIEFVVRTTSAFFNRYAKPE